MAWEMNQGSPVGGVLVNEFSSKTTKLTNHLDLPSLLPFAAANGHTHLGVRDIYALAHKEDVPFALANIQAGTIEYINGKYYGFDLPSLQENETKIVSIDEADVSQLGYGGQPFKFTLSNGRLGGFGARLTPNPMLPYALEVINFERKGEGVQYEVVYRGNMKGERFVPASALQVNGYMYKLGATRSAEFGQNYDSWEVSGANTRNYQSQITDARLQTHYHMTSEACRFLDDTRLNKDAKWVFENMDKMVEYIGIKSPLDPSMKTYQQYMHSGGDMSDSAIGFKYLTTKYDQICMGILEKMAVNTMVWDAGGITGSDGYDKGYIHPGVWHQMDYSGYKRVFSIPLFRKEMILAAIRGFRAGKESATEYGKEPIYRIKTGRGGAQLLNAAFKEEFNAQVSGQIMADSIGQFEGTYKTGLGVITPFFKSLQIAGEFKLIWEIDPSLDPTRGDDIHNPFVGGFRLSSYAMIIEDYNFSSGNIRILRNKNEGGGNMRMTVINNDKAHPLFQMNNGSIPMHAGSSLKTGFGAYFTSTPDTAIVWDPTRFLKLTPINPNTGRSIL